MIGFNKQDKSYQILMRKYNTATVQHVTMQKKTQETASKQAEENDTFKNTNEPN